MAQTAVKWIAEKMKKLTPPGYQTEISAMLEKAKQMEKEQIMKAVDRGFDKGCNLREDKLKNAEQYYNETYGNESV